MDIARHWRLRGQRYGLTGTVCSSCGKTFFTPRPVCDVCHASASNLPTFESKPTRRERSSGVLEPAQR